MSSSQTTEGATAPAEPELSRGGTGSTYDAAASTSGVSNLTEPDLSRGGTAGTGVSTISGTDSSIEGTTTSGGAASAGTSSLSREEIENALRSAVGRPLPVAEAIDRSGEQAPEGDGDVETGSSADPEVNVDYTQPPPSPPMQTLTAVAEKAESPVFNQRRVWHLLALVLVIGGVAAAISVAVTQNQDDGDGAKAARDQGGDTGIPGGSSPSAPSSAPSSASSYKPTSMPSMTRTSSLLRVLDSVSDPALLGDESTPQGMAFAWIDKDDPMQLPVPEADATDKIAEERIIQRYVAALFYYALGGDGWDRCGAPNGVPYATANATTPCDSDFERWLSGEDECTWFGMECGSDMGWEVVTNDMDQRNGNGLIGELPAELGRWTYLTSFHVGHNQIMGTIPNELLEGATGLVEFDVTNNIMTGPFPAAIEGLHDLDLLLLGQNGFTGPIMENWSNLTQLRQLYLFDNEFNGTIPQSMATLFFGQPTMLFLHVNDFTGTLPEGLCDPPRAWLLPPIVDCEKLNCSCCSSSSFVPCIPPTSPPTVSLAPSSNPTSTPSKLSTPAPSLQPTNATATESPTSAPSKAPTHLPTPSPSVTLTPTFHVVGNSTGNTTENATVV